MKTTIKSIVSAAAVGWLCLGTGTSWAQTTPATSSPDLQEVVKLSQQKMSDDIIVSYVKNTGHTYKLGAEDIIYLNSQGVSQGVISALLATGSGNGAPIGQSAPTSPAPASGGSSPAEPPPLDPGPSASLPTPSSTAPAPDMGSSPAPTAPPPMPAPAPAQAGLQDNFFAEGGLNPNLWLTQSGLLSGIASLSGRPVWTALSFSPSGMQMSGTHGHGEFMGVQSVASYSAPFSFTATVTGLAQNAIPFEVYLVSADMQQWVSVAGHLGGRGSRPSGAVDVGGGFGHVFGGMRIPLGGSERSPEYGVWVNHTGSGQPIAGLGYKIFEDVLAGIPYTIQISVGPDGGASVSLLDAGRGLLASQNVLVGTGPFYVVLAGRDGQTYANWQSVQLVSTAPAPAPVAEAAPAVPPVPTMDYFQSQLAPYGSWVNVPGYGLCWQPAVSPYWRPYVDGGSWAYTDAGWFWQSDYPWGDITFHYGRWAYTPSGWVWAPGYEYAPSWVVWRHDEVDGVVGWAPLPPGALFVDGGWRYNGVSVGADFDFGIGAGYFCFVDGGHFWDHDFRRYAVPHDRLVFVFGHSSFDNHYRYDHGHFMNEGMDRDRMARLTHRDVRDFRPRPLAEVRHQEEQHNAAARHEDARNFHPGQRPDARGGAARGDSRGGTEHPENRGGAEHPGAPAGHGPADNGRGGQPQNSKQPAASHSQPSNGKSGKDEQHH